ncbi:unnamed protein product [Mucor hiemalis]
MDNQLSDTPVSLKSTQRQTRPQDQSEPPVANPHNSTHRNTELRKEYDNVVSINRALASVVDNLEKTKSQIKHFADTVDQTDGLLDIWLSILQKSEESKAVIENAQVGEALPEKRKELDYKGVVCKLRTLEYILIYIVSTAPNNTIRRRRINE